MSVCVGCNSTMLSVTVVTVEEEGDMECDGDVEWIAIVSDRASIVFVVDCVCSSTVNPSFTLGVTECGNLSAMTCVSYA